MGSLLIAAAILSYFHVINLYENNLRSSQLEEVFSFTV